MSAHGNCRMSQGDVIYTPQVRLPPVLYRYDTVFNRLGRKGADIANFLGVGRSAVAKWRSGKTSPSRENLEALEQLLEERAPKTLSRHQRDTKSGASIGNLPKSRRVPGEPNSKGITNAPKP